jgi:hypothetical protein
MEIIQQRLERRARRAPTPRAPHAPPTGGGEAEATPSSDTHPPPGMGAGPAARPARRATPVPVPAGAPKTSFTLMVRKPLNDRLEELLYRLRRVEAPSTKVEIVEMLLAELPVEATPELLARLERFRVVAGRR